MCIRIKLILIFAACILQGQDTNVNCNVLLPLLYLQAELLCPSEKQKLLLKREKNKKAAEKCRVKRKEESMKIRQEYEEYLEANETLQSEIRKMANEKERLETILKDHNCVGAAV